MNFNLDLLIMRPQWLANESVLLLVSCRELPKQEVGREWLMSQPDRQGAMCGGDIWPAASADCPTVLPTPRLRTSISLFATDTPFFSHHHLSPRRPISRLNRNPTLMDAAANYGPELEVSGDDVSHRHPLSADEQITTLYF